MSKAPGTYNECEGIYPDGQYTNVEGDRQVHNLAEATALRTSTSGSFVWTARARISSGLLTSTTMRAIRHRIP